MHWMLGTFRSSRSRVALAALLVAAGCSTSPDDAGPNDAAGGADGDAGAMVSDAHAADAGTGTGDGAVPDRGPDATSAADASVDATAVPDARADASSAGDAGGADRAATTDAGGADRIVTGDGGALPPVTVYIAGDSTVSTYPANAANMQAGWGQMLAASFNAQVRVSNQAIGGRTSRRFIGEGRLTTILNAIRPGDYLMVQFGTNDGNTTATYADGEPYYVSPADFQTYMRMYIDGARAKQAIPVLVTPPPRRSCTGDSHSFGNGLAGYAAAMKTVGTATGAAVIDLNGKTLAYLDMIGCLASADFFLLNDGTHFQQNGARIMAGYVADGVRELALPLAAYLK